MSQIKDVTDASFRADVLSSTRPVIVEYWAPWCGPCRQVAPVVEAIASDQAGQVDVVKVSTDENPQIVRACAVLHVPTISRFSGGQVARQVTGARSKSALLAEFADFI